MDEELKKMLNKMGNVLTGILLVQVQATRILIYHASNVPKDIRDEAFQEVTGILGDLIDKGVVDD